MYVRSDIQRQDQERTHPRNNKSGAGFQKIDGETNELVRACDEEKRRTQLIWPTTKIGTFVCPPHISETVAVSIMKLAHRPRIASTTKTLISKQMLLSI